MNKNIHYFAADQLLYEIKRMVKSYNQLITEGNKSCRDVEDYLPPVCLVKDYDGDNMKAHNNALDTLYDKVGNLYGKTLAALTVETA